MNTWSFFFSLLNHRLMYFLIVLINSSIIYREIALRVFILNLNPQYYLEQEKENQRHFLGIITKTPYKLSL
jgi:RPA family protein